MDFLPILKLWNYYPSQLIMRKSSFDVFFRNAFVANWSYSKFLSQCYFFHVSVCLCAKVKGQRYLIYLLCNVLFFNKKKKLGEKKNETYA